MFSEDYNEENKEKYFQALQEKYQQFRENQSVYFEEEELLDLLEYLEERVDHVQVLELVELGLQQYPYSSDLMVHKIDILIELDKTAEAIDLMQLAIAMDASHPDLHILKIELELIQDRELDAQQSFQKALELFSGEEKIMLLHQCIDLFNDYEDYEAMFDSLVQLTQQEGDHVKERLVDLLSATEQTGRYEEAIGINQHIINKHPYSSMAWFNVGICYLSLKLYEKAVDAFLYVTAIGHGIDGISYKIAECYMQLKEYQEAIYYLQHFMRQHPKDEDLHPHINRVIGYCYSKLKDYKMARNYWMIILNKDAFNDEICHLIGESYMQEKQYVLAIEYYTRATKNKKNSASYFQAIGQAYWKLNNPTDALHYFEQAISVNQKRKTSWRYLLNTLIHLKHYERVLQLVESALYFTRDKNFTLYKAWALWQLNQRKEAKQMLSVSKSLNDPKAIRFFLQQTWMELDSPFMNLFGGNHFISPTHFLKKQKH